MNISFFDQITDFQNIKHAYFDLVKKFDEKGNAHRYRGVDGVNLSHLNNISEKILKDIQKEMLEFKQIAPAYLVTIPKKNGKKRKIFIYTIKERIKAEAIYRILEPFFDHYFSPFLFSYRASHPSYYAARSAVRRYKRYYGHNYVLVTDIVDYADTLDHEILLRKIKNLSLDEKTIRLLDLFIKTKIHESGNLITRPCGVLTGTPLYALLSNLYMDEFDQWAGKHVAFYRRVGDDIIAMDKSLQKIQEVHEKLLETTKQLKIQINQNKESLIKDSCPFHFLGYEFRDGLVGFDKNSLLKIKMKWKKKLVGLSSKNIPTKIRRFQQMAKKKKENPRYLFKRIIEQKSLIHDKKQIKELSDSLIGSLASFLFGYQDEEKKRSAAQIMKKAKAPSLWDQYLLFRSQKTNNKP